VRLAELGAKLSRRRSRRAAEPERPETGAPAPAETDAEMAARIDAARTRLRTNIEPLGEDLPDDGDS